MESIHEILVLKPYGVLGRQKLSTDDKKVIVKGDDPANMDSCVVVDAGKTHQHVQSPNTPSSFFCPFLCYIHNKNS
jgi:hypothetical protein